VVEACWAWGPRWERCCRISNSVVWGRDSLEFALEYFATQERKLGLEGKDNGEQIGGADRDVGDGGQSQRRNLEIHS